MWREERDALKVRVAGCLIETGNSDRGENWMLFVAADHLNSTENHGVDPIVIVPLNMQVGEKAMNALAFVPAFEMKALESLELPDIPWMLHYELTLRLYQSAADVARCLGHEAKHYVMKLKQIQNHRMRS